MGTGAEISPRAGGMPRRLAAVLSPVAGEALTSWVDRVAADWGLSAGHTARVLGLECRFGPGKSTFRPLFYGVLLTPASRAGLVAATGLSPERFEAMCMSWFTGTVLDFSGMDTAREGTAGSFLVREWVLARASRACPRCLAETGGVWLLWWQLGIAAACPKHAVLLVDRCSQCGGRLRRAGPGQHGSLLRSGVANPVACGNADGAAAGKGRRKPCGQRLDVLETTTASTELVAVQRAVLDVVFGAPALVAGMPVSGREWWMGLRFAAALHRMFAPSEYVRCFPGMVPQAAEEFLDGGGGAPTGPGERARRLRIPRSAAHAAADLLLAHRVLAAGSSQACAEVLRPLAAAEAELIDGQVRFPDRRDRMWAVERPEALGRIWRAIRRSRHQAFDPSINRVVRGRAALMLRVEHLPQLVGAGDYRALLAGLLHGFTSLAGRRVGALAGARLLGAASWLQAAEVLEVRHPSSAKAFGWQVNALDDLAGFWDAVAAWLDRLAARGPVDFAARRAALEELTQVPRMVLGTVCECSKIPVRPRADRYAAAWLWAELTGGDILDAPAFCSGYRLTGAELKRDGQSRRAFISRLSPQAKEHLREYGQVLLAAAGQPR